MYVLFAGDKNTLVLPLALFQGDGEIPQYFRDCARLNSCEPVDIVSRYYRRIGEFYEMDPFDFTSSNGALRFSLRQATRQVLDARKHTIDEKLCDLCTEVNSKVDRKKLGEQISGQITIEGDIYVLGYDLFDTANVCYSPKKRLFLHTAFDRPLPRTEDDVFDISLGNHSVALYGPNPVPEHRTISLNPVGRLRCVLDDLPHVLKIADEQFLQSVIEENNCPF
jgi:hypothetical protein